MRVSVEHNSQGVAAAHVSPSSSAPAGPDLSYLTRDASAALGSFYATVGQIVADNPDPRLQGRAVGAVIGFFLRLRPSAMLDEIRGTEKVFQPAFGPVLVVAGDAVRDVLERDQDFTVEPYGVEMSRVMTPRHNGGFTTFILSTDDDAAYEPDKRLLSAVCNREDAARITDVVHRDCMQRLGLAVSAARQHGSTTIDIVPGLARYVPVTLGHEYLGVPVAARPGAFELTPEMLTCYGDAIDGDAGTALRRSDGVIPDERQMYAWIKAAFRHFFNNVEKHPDVRTEGFRACRQLLAYLLREIGIQRQHIANGDPVADTMLTRLVHFQMGRSTPAVVPPADLDPRLVTDLRIAENVMGTIVGAVAGQEEATCRVIDSLLRLQEGEWRTGTTAAFRYGTFAEARQLALDVLRGVNVAENRATLHRYFLEALRLQPQGEVLLRRCARDGARIAESRPIAAGTPVFVSHASAMRDVPEADAFVLNRPREHYLQYGWGRHTCLGQYVSPVIIVESMIALLALEGVGRAAARDGEPSFPLERRTGRLQLDEQNLYATSFALQFADTGTTRRFWPAADLEVL